MYETTVEGDFIISDWVHFKANGTKYPELDKYIYKDGVKVNMITGIVPYRDVILIYGHPINVQSNSFGFILRYDPTTDSISEIDYKNALRKKDGTGKPDTVCGKCIYACPHTQKYIKRA